MGVLPLQFKAGDTRNTYSIVGTESYEIHGEIEARGDLTVIMTRKNGEIVNIPVTCRLDTSAEVEVYNAGGILQKFAKDFVAAK